MGEEEGTAVYPEEPLEEDMRMVSLLARPFPSQEQDITMQLMMIHQGQGQDTGQEVGIVQGVVEVVVLLVLGLVPDPARDLPIVEENTSHPKNMVVMLNRVEAIGKSLVTLRGHQSIGQRMQLIIILRRMLTIRLLIHNF